MIMDILNVSNIYLKNNIKKKLKICVFFILVYNLKISVKINRV